MSIVANRWNHKTKPSHQAVNRMLAPLPNKLRLLASFMGAAMAVSPMFAQKTHAGGRNSEASTQQTTAQHQREYTRKEAYRASGHRDPETKKVISGRIVLHYGEGIEDADLGAEVLNERGYPAIALAGGKDGKIGVFIARSHPVYFTQKELYDGTLLDTAESIYHDRVGQPQPAEAIPAFTPSLASPDAN